MDISYCRPKLSIYCTSLDFVKAIETISEDLAVVGLPPVVKYNENDPVPALVSLINTIWTLLQCRQQLVDGKRDLEQNISSLSHELQYLKQKQRQLESALHCKEDDLIDKKKLLCLKSEEESDSTKKIKSLKQEIKGTKQQVKSKEWQFKHDLKRQQNEIALLQSKLREVLSKEKGEKWKGPTDSSTERKSFSSNEELFKKCILRLENNIQTLVKENLELRKLLDNVSTEVADVLKDQKKAR